MYKKTILFSLFTAALALGAWTYKMAGDNKAIDTNNFDTSVKPVDNFYQYVNGSWLKNHPVPSTERVWGSFSEVAERNMNNLHAIAEEAAKDLQAPKGSNKQKVGDFYATGMDTLKIEKDGINPLKEDLALIARMKTSDDLVRMLAKMHIGGMGALFGPFVDQDDKNSSSLIIKLYQSGIGMPDKDYYLAQKPESQKLRDAYVKHVENMLQYLGNKPADAAAQAKVIMSIETELAKASRSRVELRDPEKNYNKKTIRELTELSPGFNWALYLSSMNVKVTEVIVGQPDFIARAGELVKTIPINDWKAYLQWHLIHETAPYLQDAVVKENFAFYGTTLSGITAMKPRWKRVLETVDQNVGMVMGQLFVEKHFSAEAKKKVNEMVDNLVAAYKERILSRDWMSPDTKKQAVVKLEAIVRKLAYPDKWRDNSGLSISRDSYVSNVLRSVRFEVRRRLDNLGKPVDRTEWAMTPSTVNAYYNSSMNEIVFPAGIMQPPFFHPGADDAVNYGCMGAVIGHELTHGFDDSGSQYDAQGNLKDWWTADDKQKFIAKAGNLIKQFDSYVAIDSLHVMGALTIGENIADLGGLTLAYYAFKKSLVGKPVPEKIDGFTAEQRFFISWAQGWRTNFQPTFLKQYIITNPHSPGMFRVLGPLSNMKEFYEAFGVKPGDKMHKADGERIEIW